jgi:hypothetical protein
MLGCLGLPAPYPFISQGCGRDGTAQLHCELFQGLRAFSVSQCSVAKTYDRIGNSFMLLWRCQFSALHFNRPKSRWEMPGEDVVFDRAERDNEAALTIEDSVSGYRVHSRIAFPGWVPRSTDVHYGQIFENGGIIQQISVG